MVRKKIPWPSNYRKFLQYMASPGSAEKINLHSIAHNLGCSAEQTAKYAIRAGLTILDPGNM